MDTVIIKAKAGFLANTTEKTHVAHKIAHPNGMTLYEVYYAGSRVFLAAEDVEEVAPVETFWFVKTVTRPTEQNTNHAGEEHIHIFGKGEKMLFAQTGDPWIDRDWMTPHNVLEYGYKRVCDAKRAYAYKNPERSEYWYERPQIVSVEMQKDAKGVYHIL